MSDDDDKVGYRRPPKKTRFKPGQSGNPAGRPRKPKPDEIDIAQVLNAPIRTRSAGTTRNVPAYEHMVRSLANKAMQDGDIGSILEFLRLCKKHGILMDPPASPEQSSVLRIPRSWDRDEWKAMLNEHGPPPWPGERDGLPERA